MRQRRVTITFAELVIEGNRIVTSSAFFLCPDCKASVHFAPSEYCPKACGSSVQGREHVEKKPLLTPPEGIAK